MTTTVEIIDRARPALRRLQFNLKNGAANSSIGRAVFKLLQDHFLALPPNKRGFPTTHFWRRAAGATKFESTRDSVRVSVNQIGVRQRLLGGNIDPIHGQYLTIPAIAETYGHRAGDFNDLKVVRGAFKMYTGRTVSLALVPRDWKPNPANPGDSSKVFFWLVRHVTQLPNPKVLPTNDEISQTVMGTAKEFFR